MTVSITTANQIFPSSVSTKQLLCNQICCTHPQQEHLLSQQREKVDLFCKLFNFSSTITVLLQHSILKLSFIYEWVDREGKRYEGEKTIQLNFQVCAATVIRIGLLGFSVHFMSFNFLQVLFIRLFFPLSLILLTSATRY